MVLFIRHSKDPLVINEAQVFFISYVEAHALQNLKRVEVIEDDEAEIIEAVRRMSDRYDLVVTRYLRQASLV